MTDLEKEMTGETKQEAGNAEEAVQESEKDASEEAAEKTDKTGTDTENKEEPAGDSPKEETGEEEAAAEDAEGEAGKEPKTWAEKKAAKKQAKQDKKLDPLKERIAELEDRTKRQLAEFENFRKRTEKEKQTMFEIGARSVIEKILPVIDNFERGLATVPEDKKDDAFVDGMNRVYKQMLTELEKIGVKPIEAVGKEFDPNLHNAVMQVQNEELEPGTVAQELQKGYTYRDSVVRHSMVSVVSE